MKNPGVLDKYIWGDPHELPPITVPDDGLKKKMTFNSGVDRPKPQPISLSLNVDGRTLAQAVSSQLAELMMFPTGAGAPDHWGQWADSGSNISST